MMEGWETVKTLGEFVRYTNPRRFLKNSSNKTENTLSLVQMESLGDMINTTQDTTSVDNMPWCYMRSCKCFFAQVLDYRQMQW